VSVTRFLENDLVAEKSKGHSDYGSARVHDSLSRAENTVREKTLQFIFRGPSALIGDLYMRAFTSFEDEAKVRFVAIPIVFEVFLQTYACLSMGG
jgi:hypothetical protein